MDAITGFLIRQKRFEQNISQEGLCKGICVVSYLSKIEQGLVNPSPEIIQQLFHVLNIIFYDDEEFIQTYKKHISFYMESYFLHEDTTAQELKINNVMDQLLHSPLIIDTMLYHVTSVLFQEHQYEQYIKTLDALSIYKPYMDEQQSFLYNLFHAGIKDINERIQCLMVAGRFHPCSIQKRFLAYALYCSGKSEQAIECLHESYHFACEEGNAYEMLESSLLLGNCYSNTHDEALMRKYYKRSEVLARTSHREHDLAIMQYNLGSTYLGWNQLQEAQHYLLEALKNHKQATSFSIFLLYQKLAMLYYEMKDEKQLSMYLQFANEAGEKEQDALLHKMNLFVQMYCDEQQKYSEAYISVLEELVYGNIQKQAIALDITYGFRIFHAKYLMDAYKKQRRYKDALHIKEQFENEQFS